MMRLMRLESFAMFCSLWPWSWLHVLFWEDSTWLSRLAAAFLGSRARTTRRPAAQQARDLGFEDAPSEHSINSPSGTAGALPGFETPSASGATGLIEVPSSFQVDIVNINRRRDARASDP